MKSVATRRCACCAQDHLWIVTAWILISSRRISISIHRPSLRTGRVLQVDALDEHILGVKEALVRPQAIRSLWQSEYPAHLAMRAAEIIDARGRLLLQCIPISYHRPGFVSPCAIVCQQRLPVSSSRLKLQSCSSATAPKPISANMGEMTSEPANRRFKSSK